MACIVPGGTSGCVMPLSAAAIDYVARWGAVHHWALSAAGTADSIGSATLTAVNTPTSGAAIAANLGTSTQFASASSQQMTAADAGASMDFSGSVEWWIWVWVVLDTKTATQGFVFKGTGTSQTALEVMVDYFQPADRLRVLMGNAASSGYVQPAADALGSPATGTPYGILAWRDAVAGTVSIRVNHGTATSASDFGRNPNNTAGSWRIGSRSGADYANGRIQGVALGKSPPGGIAGVIDEISSRLYNSGAGRAFPWS